MKTAEEWIASFAPRQEGPASSPCLDVKDIRDIQSDAIIHWAAIAANRATLGPEAEKALVDLAWEMSQQVGKLADLPL